MNDTASNLADASQNLRGGTNFLVRDLVSAGRVIPTGGIPIPSGSSAGPIKRPSPPGTQLYFNNTSATTLTAITTGEGLGPSVDSQATDMVTILTIDPILDACRGGALFLNPALKSDGTTTNPAPVLATGRIVLQRRDERGLCQRNRGHLDRGRRHGRTIADQEGRPSDVHGSSRELRASDCHENGRHQRLFRDELERCVRLQPAKRHGRIHHTDSRDRAEQARRPHGAARADVDLLRRRDGDGSAAPDAAAQLLLARRRWPASSKISSSATTWWTEPSIRLTSRRCRTPGRTVRSTRPARFERSTFTWACARRPCPPSSTTISGIISRRL